MALTRVTDLVSEILATQLNQYAELLEGDALKGKPVALTALSDLTNWALQAANQDTTNGRAFRVLKANLTDPWIQADVNGVLIDNLQAVIQSIAPTAPGTGRASMYPFSDGWRSKIASGPEFRILGASAAPTDGYALLGQSGGVNLWEPIARKNRLVNYGFNVVQKNAFTTTDNAYGFDRWRLLIEAASAAVLTQETSDVPAGGSHYACKLSVGATNNKKIGVFQPIEGQDIWDLRGGVASLQFAMKVNNARIGDVRAAVVQWTGTEDATSADPINAWGTTPTIPTYTGSWANANTPANLSPTTSWATYKVENISISASATNLAVFIWIEDQTTTVADYLLVADVQLEKGAVCTAIERRPYEQELRLAQRYCETFNAGSSQFVLGVGQATNTTDCYVPWVYKVRKRTTPTSFVASGTWASSNTSGTVNLSASPAASPPALTGLDVALVKFTTAGSMTAGSAVTVASGGVGNGYLEASAEL